MAWNNEKLISILKDGGVAVMSTDTIYGLVGRAENEETVNRIYEIKKRAPEKPCIILISDTKDLEKFSVHITPEQEQKLKEYWPGRVSIILACGDEKLSYLHRGTGTLAFRLPGAPLLRELLERTGPLVAPSANPESFIPASNIEKAREYFREAVDWYEDGGEITGNPSKLVELHKDGEVRILRE